MSALIQFDGVRKRLGGRVVLDRMDLEIRKGEIFVLVGASGTGKSVTLKHIIRLLTPDEGAVWVGGERMDLARGVALRQLRDRFGVLFQGGALLQWMTVADNVALPLREKTSLDEAKIARRVRDRLTLLNLEDFADAAPAELSGGMQKRAALARAIVSEPEIILYDEPTSGLDPVTSRHIDAIIADMRDRLGVTSVVVTHDLHSALSIGTRIAVIDEGRLVEVASPDAFVRSQNPVVRAFLKAQYISRDGLGGEEHRHAK